MDSFRDSYWNFPVSFVDDIQRELRKSMDLLMINNVIEQPFSFLHLVLVGNGERIKSNPVNADSKETSAWNEGNQITKILKP